MVDPRTNHPNSCLWSKTVRDHEIAFDTPCRQRFRSLAVVVVVELPQMPDDDLRSPMATRGRRTC